MTPDELRRMDNDQCIIFEKGVKPVKARKFYYFKHPMAKKLAACEISHNDIGEIDRGTWRKYNPYNPYVPEDENKEKVDNLKVESLDDLFDDEPSTNKTEEKSKEKVNVATSTGKDLKVDLGKIESEVNQSPKLDLNDFEDSAPILPQSGDDDEELYDL